MWIQVKKILFISRECRYSREDFGTNIHDLFFIGNVNPVQPVNIRNLQLDKFNINIPT